MKEQAKEAQIACSVDTYPGITYPPFAAGGCYFLETGTKTYWEWKHGTDFKRHIQSGDTTMFTGPLHETHHL